MKTTRPTLSDAADALGFTVGKTSAGWQAMCAGKVYGTQSTRTDAIDMANDIAALKVRRARIGK